MWQTQQSRTVKAPSKAIWERWIDVSNWPKLDDSLVSASLAGEFAIGSLITLKPKGSPSVLVKLIEVTPEKSFSTIGSLPLATLRFDHLIEETKDSTQFTQRVSMTGPFSSLFGKLMGPKMAENLAKRVDNLAANLNQTAK